jgi:uncharacterized protein YdeI (YjbR/CyaY-like superfamily)
MSAKEGKRNLKADVFFRKAEQWREEMEELRKIILGFPLTEELKWSKPCYAFEKNNVVIIIPFKESCALMFCKGALLKDAKGVLARPGEHTQAGRWIKFTSVREITGMKTLLKAYIKEAIAAEKGGLKVNYKKTSEYAVPEEFQKKLREMPTLKAAFDALTPGRQRGFLLYFSAAKQSKTRESRIEKCIDLILDGKGLQDDYAAKRS